MKRKIRTCPLCGEKFHEESLVQHLRESHEGDQEAISWHLNRALLRLLNQRKAAK